MKEILIIYLLLIVVDGGYCDDNGILDRTLLRWYFSFLRGCLTSSLTFRNIFPPEPFFCGVLLADDIETQEFLVIAHSKQAHEPEPIRVPG